MFCKDCPHRISGRNGKLICSILGGYRGGNSTCDLEWHTDETKDIIVKRPIDPACTNTKDMSC